MTDKQYVLTLTETQAEVMNQALEVLARLGIGQFRDALYLMPLRPTADYSLMGSMVEIEKILRRHMNDNGLGPSMRAAESEHTQVAWDMYQVIRHRLSWDRAVEDGLVASLDAPRDWLKMTGVNYDDPMRTGPEPLAKIERAE